MNDSRGLWSMRGGVLSHGNGEAAGGGWDGDSMEYFRTLHETSLRRLSDGREGLHTVTVSS